MRHRLATLGAILVLFAGWNQGCGSSSPTTATPPTTAPRASASKVTVGAENASLTVTSRSTVVNLVLVCGNGHAEWHFIESAGLGATITHSDVYLIQQDGDITDRVSQDRTDRIEANQSLRVNSDRVALCGYEGRDFPPTIKGEFVVRDDNGNVTNLTAEAVLIEK